MIQLATIVFALTLGPWNIQFQEDAQTLRLENPESGVTVSGTLAFATSDQNWRIAPPRDAVPTRLALVDKNNDVQGYISFQQNGTRLEMLVSHRTRQFYEGVLKFDGTIDFDGGSERFTFPCKTKASPEERVLFLASGQGNSGLNDSIYVRDEDLMLRLNDAKIEKESKNSAYKFHMSGRIQEAAEASFVFDLEKNYYKTRYIPYFTPIDRKRCPSPPTGWMSWNVYFDKAMAEDNLAEARVGQKYLQPFGMEFWSIESWQGNSDQLPVSNFYNLNLEANEKQFPLGMKKLADDIRALGFRPGLWTAPFGTGNKEFYEQHKDWFLHGKDGQPLRTWNGVYTIDPSNDEVIEHLRKIHDIAAHQWGYEFFKIDGMSGSSGGYCAHFFERPYVKEAFKNPDCPAPFERCVAAFREGIGPDRVFLACQGHFSGPEPKYADAARTGADIVHPNQPVKWGNLMNQAGRTLNQVFAHNIVFFSDPDTLLVNEALTLEEARLSTTVVALPGQMMFSGDRLAQLPPERMRLLQQALPVCDVHPMNMYPIFRQLPIWDLKVTQTGVEYDVAALFNWTEEDGKIAFDFAELGLDSDREYVLYEFWTNTVATARGHFEWDVPRHAVRLFAIHPVQSVPQFLSSDRHVTQGAVDVSNVSWAEENQTLSLSVKLVANHPTTLRLRVPEGFKPSEVVISPEVRTSVKSEANGVLALTLTSATTQSVNLEQKFVK